jgi:hypothetical protein
MLYTKDDCENEIFRTFERTSRWRAQLQKKFPDARNGRASAALSRLASEPCSLTDSEWLLLETHCNGPVKVWKEALEQTSRAVEFHIKVKTFSDFVRHLLFELSTESENNVAA